jgi:hypothetical protein
MADNEMHWGWKFPQPARAGDLIGRTVLDDDSGTIGRVTALVRDASGAILIVFTEGGLFGFGARQVAVPLRQTGMLGQYVALFDMLPAQLDKMPAFNPSGTTPLDPNETIQVGLAQR